jgi:hypothetical protein
VSQVFVRRSISISPPFKSAICRGDFERDSLETAAGESATVKIFAAPSIERCSDSTGGFVFVLA